MPKKKKYSKKYIKSYNTGGNDTMDPLATQTGVGARINQALSGVLGTGIGLAPAFMSMFANINNVAQDTTPERIRQLSVSGNQGFTNDRLLTFQLGGGNSRFQLADIRGMMPLVPDGQVAGKYGPGTMGKTVSETVIPVEDMPEQMDEGGSPAGQVVQTTKGEVIAFGDGQIATVGAKKTHKQMKDDKATDIVPNDAYILSNDKKMRFTKKEAEDVEFGYSPITYKEGEAPSVPKRITLADDLGGNNKYTPAEAAKKIRAKYQLSSLEDDAFAEHARRENLASRIPRLQALVQFNESKKPKKDRMKTPEEMMYGGKPKKYQTGGDPKDPPRVPRPNVLAHMMSAGGPFPGAGAAAAAANFVPWLGRQMYHGYKSMLFPDEQGQGSGVAYDIPGVGQMNLTRPALSQYILNRRYANTPADPRMDDALRTIQRDNPEYMKKLPKYPLGGIPGLSSLASIFNSIQTPGPLAPGYSVDRSGTQFNIPIPNANALAGMNTVTPQSQSRYSAPPSVPGHAGARGRVIDSNTPAGEQQLPPSIFDVLGQDLNRLTANNSALSLGQGLAGAVGPFASLMPLMQSRAPQLPIDILKGLPDSVPQFQVDQAANQIGRRFNAPMNAVTSNVSRSGDIVSYLAPMFGQQQNALSNLASNQITNNQRMRSDKLRQLYSAISQQRQLDRNKEDEKATALGAGISNSFENAGNWLGSRMALNTTNFQNRLGLTGAMLNDDYVRSGLASGMGGMGGFGGGYGYDPYMYQQQRMQELQELGRFIAEQTGQGQTG